MLNVMARYVVRDNVDNNLDIVAGPFWTEDDAREAKRDFGRRNLTQKFSVKQLTFVAVQIE